MSAVRDRNRNVYWEIIKSINNVLLKKLLDTVNLEDKIITGYLFEDISVDKF